MGVSRDGDRSRPSARVPTSAPAAIAAMVGTPNSSAAAALAAATARSTMAWRTPRRAVARTRRAAVAIVMPPVTGASPASAAFARGAAATSPYAAVSPTVMAAAGIIIPATEAAAPRHPATRLTDESGQRYEMDTGRELGERPQFAELACADPSLAFNGES